VWKNGLDSVVFAGFGLFFAGFSGCTLATKCSTLKRAFIDWGHNFECSLGSTLKRALKRTNPENL